MSQVQNIENDRTLLEAFRLIASDAGARAALATEPALLPDRVNCSCSEVEMAALLELRGPLLAYSDERLGRAVRSLRRDQPFEQAQLVERLLQYRRRVMEAAEAHLASISPPKPIAALMMRMMRETAGLAEVVPCLPAIDFPAAVAAGAGRDMLAALPASVAMLFYYMGVSLYDDIIDRDLSDDWTREPENQIAFTAITMFSGMPVVVLERMLPEHQWRPAVARCAYWVQRGAYELNVGQYLDVSLTLARGATPRGCEEIVELKTGSTGALAVRLTAELVGLSEGQAEKWASVATATYSAMQIASDINDIWAKPLSPDLDNGILTLPIVHACTTLQGQDRDRFLELLGSRSAKLEDHAEMRRLITGSGALRCTLLRAEIYRQRALSVLAEMEMGAEGRAIMAYITQVAQIGDLGCGLAS